MKSPKEKIMEALKDAVTEYVFSEISEAKRELKKQYVFWCDRNQIPAFAKPLDAYESATEFIILFGKEPLPETHNCDEMGCSTVSHVRLRIKK